MEDGQKFVIFMIHVLFSVCISQSNAVECHHEISCDEGWIMVVKRAVYAPVLHDGNVCGTISRELVNGATMDVTRQWANRCSGRQTCTQFNNNHTQPLGVQLDVICLEAISVQDLCDTRVGTNYHYISSPSLLNKPTNRTECSINVTPSSTDTIVTIYIEYLMFGPLGNDIVTIASTAKQVTLGGQTHTVLPSIDRVLTGEFGKPVNVNLRTTTRIEQSAGFLASFMEGTVYKCEASPTSQSPVKVIEAQHGHLQSPDYPNYGSRTMEENYSCNWTITVNAAQTIEFYFNVFELDDSKNADECLDFVQITEKSGDQISQVYKDCGQQNGHTIQSTSNKVTVLLKSRSSSNTAVWIIYRAWPPDHALQALEDSATQSFSPIMSPGEIRPGWTTVTHPLAVQTTTSSWVNQLLNPNGTFVPDMCELPVIVIAVSSALGAFILSTFICCLCCRLVKQSVKRKQRKIEKRAQELSRLQRTSQGSSETNQTTGRPKKPASAKHTSHNFTHAVNRMSRFVMGVDAIDEDSEFDDEEFDLTQAPSSATVLSDTDRYVTTASTKRRTEEPHLYGNLQQPDQEQYEVMTAPEPQYGNIGIHKNYRK